MEERMKFFLDTANLAEIRDVAGWGILDGVTTNPSLCAKENMPFEDLIKEICRLCPGPVSVECVSAQAAEILPEARRLAALAPNIAVKIPALKG
jgi:transaldolase